MSPKPEKPVDLRVGDKVEVLVQGTVCDYFEDPKGRIWIIRIGSNMVIPVTDLTKVTKP